MNKRWNSILKVDVSNWNTSAYSENLITYFEVFRGNDEDTQHQAKIELRRGQKDKAIGVTITHSEWKGLKNAIENQNTDKEIITTNDRELYFSRPSPSAVHVYTDENGRIFGLRLSKADADRLALHANEIDFLIRVCLFPDNSLLQKLIKETLASIIASLTKLESVKDCNACMFMSYGGSSDTNEHSCYKGKIGVEVLALDAFRKTMNSTYVDQRFQKIMAALVMHLKLPQDSVNNLISTWLPLLRNSEEIKLAVMDTFDNNDSCRNVIEKALETYYNSIKPVDEAQQTAPKRKANHFQVSFN